MYMRSTFVIWPHYKHSCGFIAIFIIYWNVLKYVTYMYNMYNGKKQYCDRDSNGVLHFCNNNELVQQSDNVRRKAQLNTMPSRSVM